MPDFTLKTYIQLLETVQKKEYTFKTFRDLIENPNGKSIIMRHDVDRLPENALKIAELEKSLGVRGSYYFRSVKESYDEEIIRKIAGMGHEVGYHYENLAEIGKRSGIRSQKPEVRSQEGRLQPSAFSRFLPNPNPQILSPLTSHRQIYPDAITDFKKNLDRFREICPIKTICMHGSPLSKIDNRDLWKVYDYRDFGIIGEPYFDVDYNEVLYLTDTGRRWDGSSFNVRDRVNEKIEDRREKIEEKKYEKRNSKFEMKIIKQEKRERRQESEAGGKELKTNTSTSIQNSFHSTFDIIKAAKEGRLPDKMMINVHPQRWNDRFIPWFWELVSQNVKNVFKRYFYIRNEKRGKG